VFVGEGKERPVMENQGTERPSVGGEAEKAMLCTKQQAVMKKTGNRKSLQIHWS
jgi:hypothetical protein